MNLPCHEPVMQTVVSEDKSLTLNLKVNGQMRRLSLLTNDQSLGSLLSALAVRKELVAIALNDMIVPRGEWDRTLVSEGDRLEIVHFVGGGCPLEGLPAVSDGKNCLSTRQRDAGPSRSGVTQDGRKTDPRNLRVMPSCPRGRAGGIRHCRQRMLAEEILWNFRLARIRVRSPR